MCTDPPYGMEYDPNWRTKRLGEKKGAQATGKVLNDYKADWREAWALFPGDVAYVWHAGSMAHVVAESLLATDFEIRAQIVWNKSVHVIGRGHYHPKHEPCWYAVRKGGTGHWQGSRKESTVWDIEHRRSETGHGTQKPIDAMRRPIVNNSEAGDRVYEPFSGSGTTIMAAHLTGRICHAIELNPEYVDVGVTRWQLYTGEDAVLVGTGQTFAEVKAERLGQG
jgi:DNA modification methylase